MSLIANSADVDPTARVARSARIWHLAQVREGASVGSGTVLGRGAYVDRGVSIGENCKIQNYALIYAPATIADGVFIGPAAVCTNDTYPRAVDPTGRSLWEEDWSPSGVEVGRGASVGARSVILGGVSIGEWALIGAGAVVTGDVGAHALVVGVPGRQVGWVGRSGRQLQEDGGYWVEPGTGERFVASPGGLEQA